MKTSYILLPLILSACAMVTSNDGETVVIDWRDFNTKEQVQETATRSCQEVGKKSAIELSDVSAVPGMPDWLIGRRAVTYRCSMAPPVPMVAKSPQPQPQSSR
jgi:hypothetical protein